MQSIEVILTGFPTQSFSLSPQQQWHPTNVNQELKGNGCVIIIYIWIEVAGFHLSYCNSETFVAEFAIHPCSSLETIVTWSILLLLLKGHILTSWKAYSYLQCSALNPGSINPAEYSMHEALWPHAVSQTRSWYRPGQYGCSLWKPTRQKDQDFTIEIGTWC